MRAAVLSRYGDLDGLEIRDVPEPTVGPGKLKVRIAASSLNPLDVKLVSGALKAWFPLQLPAILGFDAAGEVVELGPGVSGFRVGDKVLGQIRHGQAELALATPEQVAKVPPGFRSSTRRRSRSSLSRGRSCSRRPSRRRRETSCW